MLRASGVLLATVKKSTGICGVAVEPNARNVLIGLYQRTLDEIKVIPETAAYRQEVERFTKLRLEIVQNNQEVDKIEDEIGGGQAEELIIQAKNELQLIPQYASWKMWERKAVTPMDDDSTGIFNDLEYADPESFANAGLRDLAKKSRAQAEKRRSDAAAAAAAAATAAAKAATAAPAAGAPAAKQ